MNLETKINEEIKSAMLAKEKERLNALRAVKSALLLLKTEKAGAEITEEAEMKLLQKLVKQRTDAALLYHEQGRADLEAEELAQMKVIAAFLPAPLSDDEIKIAVKQMAVDNALNSIKDMGKLMGLASKAFAGKADNKRVADIVKEILQ